MPRLRHPLPVAVAALLLALAWRTERFQRWAFPETYYDGQVQRLEDAIAGQRAAIRDIRDQMADLRRRADTPEDADLYLTARHGLEEDVAAAEDMITLYRADLDAARAALAEFRRQP